MSDYFQTRLSQIKFKSPATIRLKGLAIGIEVGTPRYASRLQEDCRKAGLLITGWDNVLVLFPALTLDQKVAEEGLDILEDCALAA